jgi:hypothetical protein
MINSHFDDENRDVTMILNYILKLIQNKSQGGLLPLAVLKLWVPLPEVLTD